MHKRQTRAHSLPERWLISDARNDAVLEKFLRSAPQPIGLVFRHYHLPPTARRARYDRLKHVAAHHGHLVVLSGSPALARRWRAHGCYGPPGQIEKRRAGLIAITTAHGMAEIAMANRIGADAVMLSPVFQTRSHPGARTLGPVRFHMIARHAQMPVIALGGVNARRARRLGAKYWAAIDGFSVPRPRLPQRNIVCN